MKRLHPLKRAEFRDQAQRPSVVKSRPCWRLTCSVNSVHKLTSPDNQKAKRPHLKAWTCLGRYPCCTCDEMSVKLSSRMQKRLFTQLQAMQALRNVANPRHSGQLLKPVMIDDNSKKVSPRHGGQLFKTSTIDRVRQERWTTVSLYLNELLD